MSYKRERASRIAFYEVPETCPKVDEALNQAAELIKEQTSALRSSLCEFIERALSAEDELEDANERIKELEKHCDWMQEQIEHLTKELERNEPV